MNRQAYNDFRGWQLPADENGTDEGISLNIWTAENLTRIALTATLAGVQKRYSKRLTAPLTV
jgi:hypothetical protein